MSNNSKLSFFGKGSTYFAILILNAILTVFSLGLYYPWAKAVSRKYIWNETEMYDSHFVFHGTGKEMFRGWIIVWTALILFFALPMLSIYHPIFAFGSYIIYLVLFLIAPIAIYGAWRYRVTRTSWRGVFFQFNGNFKEFAKIYLKGLFLTIITLGIYYSWFKVSVQKYLFSHTKLGNIKFDFGGDPAELFGINFIGRILSVLSINLYTPILIKQRFNFTISNIVMDDGQNRQNLKSSLTNGQAWGTMAIAFITSIFTLGLAFPWVSMKMSKMFLESIILPQDFDFNNLEQAPMQEINATQDQILDVIDFDFGF